MRAGGLLLIFSGLVFAKNPTSIDRIFSDADFRPTVPSRAAIESVYGKGKDGLKDGSIVSFYRIGNDRQMRVLYSDGTKINTTFATEVTVCKCKFVDEAPDATTPVLTNALLSRRIGDSSRSLERNNDGYRYVKRTERIGLKNFLVYETNPVSGETDLYVQYWTFAGRIVGLTIGVTE